MQFPKACKLHLIAAKAPGRYAMDYIRHEAGKLIATDGRRLVILNVTDDDGEPDALIPVALVKAAILKSPTRAARVIVNGDAQALTKEGKISAPLGEGEFPKYQQILPKVPKERRVLVGLNAKYLFELAQAIGAEDHVIALELDLEQLSTAASYPNPITFENENGRAVLMPVTVTRE